jgi:tetratricopeptide (TPR) repeat protein
MIKIYLTYLSLLFIIACEPTTKKVSDERLKIYNDSLNKKKKEIEYDILIDKYNFIIKSGGILDSEAITNMYNYDSTNIDNINKMAISLIERKRVREGLRYFDKALLRIPVNNKILLANQYHNKAIGWKSTYYRDSVHYYLEKAIITDSFNIKHLNISAVIYKEEHQLEKALSQMNRAIAIQPLNRMLYINRGILKADLGYYKEAFDDLNQMPSYVKNNKQFCGNAYKYRGLVYLKLLKIKESIACCDSALVLTPNDGDVYSIRGLAKSNLQDFEGAYKDFKKAVDLGSQEAIPIYKQYKEFYETHKQI